MAFRKITSLGNIGKIFIFSFMLIIVVVGAASEALGLAEDPLDTTVGMEIEAVTEIEVHIDESGNDYCHLYNLILTSDNGIFLAIKSLKKRFVDLDINIFDKNVI